jgi:serine/tyrosine/threonine adenylyltransferase
MPAAQLFPFDNSFARLGDGFFARLNPVPVREPRLLKVNMPLAARLGIDVHALSGPEGVAMLAGVAVPENAAPLAAAYAGHQFGHFNPQLGDGRAILLGEVVAPDGARFDIQLKGSGRTPFSRGGDGRAAVGPVLREYLMGEAMHAFGIPTTRALAAVATGEWIMRDEPLPGAILTRVAASHIRIGSFQFFAARGDLAAIRDLADHAIARHDPDLTGSVRRYLDFLHRVIARQAALVAQWMAVGFIHGVMNTDNMTVSGETIDYGPCAFMDRYDPATVFSSIDRDGRYAYANQPMIARWNLARLAETLVPLLDDDEERALALANEAIGGFGELFEQAFTARMGAKLGLDGSHADDRSLIADWLRLMQAGQADFTNAFRALSAALESESEDERPSVLTPVFGPVFGLDEWLARWRQRLLSGGRASAAITAGMNAVNPVVIPRNHRVEAALAAAVEGDLGLFERLLDVLAQPFAPPPDRAGLDEPAPADAARYRTFCGT